MIDDKEFNLVSQSAHAFSGAFIGLLGMVLHQWWIPAGFVVYSAVKEFWYDAKYETPEVRGSSLEDFLVSTGGAGIGVIVGVLLCR